MFLEIYKNLKVQDSWKYNRTGKWFKDCIFLSYKETQEIIIKVYRTRSVNLYVQSTALITNRGKKKSTTYLQTFNLIRTKVHVILTLNLILNLREKQILLFNLSKYYTWRNIKKALKSNDSKFTGPTWGKNFNIWWFLFHCWYMQLFSVCNKKRNTSLVSDNTPIKNFVNKIKIRIIFKIKNG